MNIYLQNTLTGKKEKFEPIKVGEVSMYHCGPTVYNFPHIGNLRAYVFADILRRMFESNDLKVHQVVNITDIGHLQSDADEGEDKMTLALKREGKPLTLDAMKELADYYTEAFKKDLALLNIEMPTELPKASEHISEYIKLIETLKNKGFAYITGDGVYFDTKKFKGYGKLGNIQVDNLKEGARVSVNTEKKHPADFSVWKFNDEIGFETPFGKGFPGWHIECSAMSMKYLGETFDVHTGGIDHIPVHHNNEIAQSEAATGQHFVNYWMHSNFISIDSQKISKSLSNDIYMADIIQKDIYPLAYRYWLLQSHYSTPANFTWDALQASQNAYRKLIEYYGFLRNSGSVSMKANEAYLEKFHSFINDDLDTPKALALLWDLIKNSGLQRGEILATIDEFDKVLGLDIKKESARVVLNVSSAVPEEIRVLVKQREKAREEKNWALSDQLRNELLNKGFEVHDTNEGPIVAWRKPM